MTNLVAEKKFLTEYKELNLVNSNIYDNDKFMQQLFNLYLHLDDDELLKIVVFAKQFDMVISEDIYAPLDFKFERKFDYLTEHETMSSFAEKFFEFKFQIPNLSTVIIEHNNKRSYYIYFTRMSYMGEKDNNKKLQRLLEFNWKNVVSKKQWDIIYEYLICYPSVLPYY